MTEQNREQWNIMEPDILNSGTGMFFALQADQAGLQISVNRLESEQELFEKIESQELDAQGYYVLKMIGVTDPATWEPIAAQLRSKAVPGANILVYTDSPQVTGTENPETHGYYTYIARQRSEHEDVYEMLQFIKSKRQ